MRVGELVYVWRIDNYFAAVGNYWFQLVHPFRRRPEIIVHRRHHREDGLIVLVYVSNVYLRRQIGGVRPGLFWRSHVQAWTQFPFTLYLRNTLFITILNMIGAVFSTSLIGYALARIQFPARPLFFAMVIGTMLLPTEVTFIPEYLIWWKLGFLNTFVPLILPGWLALGASKVFLLRQFFRTIPKELEDAAKIDGATPFDCYWRIALPLSKPALGVVMIFEFIGSQPTAAGAQTIRWPGTGPTDLPAHGKTLSIFRTLSTYESG